VKLPAYLGPGPVLILILVLILGGAYAGYWFFVAAKLQAGIVEWVAQQRAAGNAVTIADGSIGGFPLAFRRDFGAATLTIQGDAPLSVTAGSAVAEIRPWNLNHVIFAARDLSLTGAQGAYRAGAAGGSIDIPKTPPADYHQPFLGFDISAAQVTLPAGQRAVTAGPIETLAAQGAIMGPVAQGASLQDAIAAWAATGGVLELKHFSFAQAPLDLTGEGTLALDELLQPLGALTITAHGLTDTVVLLEQDGMIDARSAKTARLMADGLAKPDAAGKPRVSVSLSLQQGHVWLGPVKLARLPALRW
jgi:hypothetical protein